MQGEEQKNLKQRFLLTLFLIAVLIFAACKAQPTWQEQYDLGMRYLSESNYEQAIIAFTAAIEIDPNQAQAYLSRAQAYLDMSGEAADDALTNAQLDYEQALRLDDTLVEGYLGLAEIYQLQGNLEKAAEVLQQGIAKTGDARLKTQMDIVRRLMDPYLLDERFGEREGYRAFQTLSEEEQTLIQQAITLFEQGQAEKIVEQLGDGFEMDFYTMYEGYKVQATASRSFSADEYNKMKGAQFISYVSDSPGIILQLRQKNGTGYIYSRIMRC